MYELAKTLFPIHRSLTGSGVRKTLGIIKNIVPLEIHDIASGENVFDWVIPDEWHINSAYIKDEYGNKIVDISDNNLHIVAYSEPFSGTITLDELKKHLYTLPEYPDTIPFITSYYKRQWGFCITQYMHDGLKNCMYHVSVDSYFKKGSLTYGEILRHCLEKIIVELLRMLYQTYQVELKI